jgi:endoglucanase
MRMLNAMANGELSHCLPELITAGNRILRADLMTPILLRGINRSGLEYTQPSPSGWLAAAQFTQDQVREIVTGWRANIIRVPFNQRWALDGANGHTADEYLTALDQVISWAAEIGAYTILDLQWLDSETVYGQVDQGGKRVDNHVPPLPNPESIELWRMLARRYYGESAVLFDLLNEPHPPLADDFNPLYIIGPNGEPVASDSTFVTADDWVAWAARLIDEVRSIRPDGLILVGGIDWAFDLRDIRIQEPNIVYSAHVYPVRKASTWPKALNRNTEVSVFIGEWGGTDADLQFGRDLAAQMSNLGLGWCAWSWVDYPQLRQVSGAPTLFGELVRNELRDST